MVEKLNFLNALMEQSHNRAPVKLASNALNDVLYNNNTPLANKPSTATMQTQCCFSKALPLLRLPANVRPHGKKNFTRIEKLL
jgi:hypothetical protein